MRGNMNGMEEVSVDRPTFELLPKGTYCFLVQTKEDKTSRSGDPMVALTLEVADGEYAGKLVWDNIILSTNPESKGWKIRWRAKMFLAAIGEEHKGDSFAWDSDRWIYCKCLGLVEHEPKTDKDGKPLVPEQMKAVIKQYLPLTAEKAAVEAAEEVDKDIPF